MNGHDDYYDLIDYEDQNKQYDENGEEIKMEEKENDNTN